MIAIRTREEFEKMSVVELVNEQQKIMNKIIQFEDKYILHKEKDTSQPPFKPTMLVSPSPTVVWRVISKELIIITNLIDEKTRDKNGIGIDF